ncbi:MAG: DEAD/DEAH box helicase [Acetobacteraceae bacterium]|nr:DEAD/DEAH box helicase [Acetobacteraceae bacterium]
MYSHQARAIDLVLKGHNVVAVTPTASGKTLCYNLPVLQAVLDDPAARAIYLFPTKALSQDQLAELHGLIDVLGADIKTHTYDGDTPAAARRAIRAAGHIVITNPDMLHTGILPHHTKWMKLFENLRYVVIDELHHYRGVFGSHLANLIRRLKRVCRFYGSNPRFILCSATIANPGELAEGLIGEKVEVVAESGAPRGEKHFIFYNPPVLNARLGIRRSCLLDAKALAAMFLRQGIQTIVFGRTRLAVEVLLSYLREACGAGGPGAGPECVRGYRGGYLPLQRREIERGLKSGEVRGVVSTNALELGIDIGQLDACVMAGYPGTVASTWQQAGRAGRRSGTSVAILVASSSPLDQYIINHPDYFFGLSPEHGLINPNNRYILLSHLKCAAFELPFEEGELFGVATTDEALRYLEEQGVLRRTQGRFYWASESFPAEDVSLRSASTDNFVVIDCTRPEPRVIGEVDRFSAPMLIHEEAIYLHEGEQYQVERLDYEEKKAYVRRVDVDYYTDASLAVNLKVLTQADRAPVPGGERFRGEVQVNALATIFKKIRFHTHENVGWGRIHLPEQEMHTTAYWLALGPEADRIHPSELQSALAGLANLMVNVAPILLMCDPRDIRAVSHTRCPFTGRPTVYVYDACPGGVGLSERLFELHPDVLQMARDLVRDCPCPDGCPSCTLGGGEEPNKSATLRLLEILGAAGPRAHSPESGALTAARQETPLVRAGGGVGGNGGVPASASAEEEGPPVGRSPGHAGG